MAIVLDTDKCYLLGLLVWGGIMRSGWIQIVLPYDKWWKIELDPKRWWIIAEDILKRAKPIWKAVYNVDVSYQIGKKSWTIAFDNISDELREDLRQLGLLNAWEFRQNANIEILEKLMTDKEMLRQFIGWMVDTVGSLAESHRRFSSNFQIISFEFMWKNFSLVLSMIKMFFRLGIVPDQILWNHPNQHSWSDRYYFAWKKWFKIRVVLDDYALRWSFLFQSKKLSAEKNHSLQESWSKTSDWKDYRINWRTCLHQDENSEWIPENIRGRHFIHFTHLASYLGVLFPGAPTSIQNPEEYICLFTILSKWTKDEIDEIIKGEPYLKMTEYMPLSFDLKELYDRWEQDINALLFWNSITDGFPLNMILRGIAYIIAASSGKVKGKRVLWNYKEYIEWEIVTPINKIKIYKPNRGTCLQISNGKFSCLVGYINDNFTKSFIKQKWLEIVLENPTFEDCIIL